MCFQIAVIIVIAVQIHHERDGLILAVIARIVLRRLHVDDDILLIRPVERDVVIVEETAQRLAARIAVIAYRRRRIVYLPDFPEAERDIVARQLKLVHRSGPGHRPRRAVAGADGKRRPFGIDQHIVVRIAARELQTIINDRR